MSPNYAAHPLGLITYLGRMLRAKNINPDRWDKYEYIAYMQVALARSLFYLMDLDVLRLPQKLAEQMFLEEKGQNLSAVLHNLLKNEVQATELRQTLRRLLAGCVNITVETTGSFLVTFLHYQNAGGKIRKSDLGLESDGTLRVLGVLAALFQAGPETQGAGVSVRQFLALEEPETNIHPGMLGVLAELFVEASAGGKQILLTTHSPDLLDFLPPESFRVVEKVDGETRVGSLADSQVEIVRQHLFTPGELLRAEGLHRQGKAPETAPDQPAAAA